MLVPNQQAVQLPDHGLLTSAGAATFTRQAATGLLSTGTVGSVATTFGYNTFGELTSHTTTAGGALYSSPKP